MAKIISIANQKGGVGKTTTAINLSASIAAAENRTLLIDIDPQSNSTSGLGYSGDGSSGKSIYEVLVGSEAIEDCIISTYMPYLDLLPSTINLVGAEVELVNVDVRESVLKKAIRTIQDRYDYVFIDCPPSLNMLTLNSLTASNSVLIPVQCEYFALEGLGQLLNTINIVKKHFNESLTIEGVVLTMFDTRLRLSHQVAEEVRKYFGNKVFDTMIQRNVRLSEAPSHSKPVILYDAISVGAQNYIGLASELMKRNPVESSSPEKDNLNEQQ
jgi:chromosome partitioning protein